MNQKKKQTTSITKKQKIKASKNNWENLQSKKWFFPLLFIFITLVAYSNSFGVPFQFDDTIQIANREWFHSFDYFKRFSNWLNVNERPFSFFTITINYVLHGERVFGYHLINFLIHCTSGIMLFYWLKLLPGIKNDESRSKWFPLVIALFFLVQPVQTQSVTYIIQRMSSLAGLCLILSVYFYTKGRFKHIENENFKSGIILYLLSIFFGILGVLSKQNAVIFPVILLLVEYFFIRNKEGKVSRTYLIAALSAGAVAVIALLIIVGLPAETTTVTRMQYLATEMIVIPRYFQMMLVPIGLSIDHGVKIVDGFLNFGSALGALFILGLLVAAILMIKKEPLFSFGIFWIFITLSVESSVIPIIDPMFDQRMYLPIVGFGIALWAMADRYLFRERANLLKPIVLVILILFSVMTIARNNVWSNRITIWEDVTEKYPDYKRGWIALGKMCLNDKENPDVARSIECFERARTIDPTDEENLIDLGFACLSLRQEEKAMDSYTQLLNAKNPEYREQALRVLAAYNVSRGNIQLADQYFRMLLTMKPGDEGVWKSLFTLYFDQKEYARAKEIAIGWDSKSPGNSNAAYSLGKSYFYLKDRDAAEQYLLSALRLDQGNADPMMLYANVCVNKLEYDEAIRLLEKAYSINNNSSIPQNIELIKQLKIRVPRVEK